MLSFQSNINHIVGCSGSLPEPISQSQEIGDDVIALCTGKFYDNPIASQDDQNNDLLESISYENSQSQEIGDNVVALCTGGFYDNPIIVSQNSDNKILDTEVGQNTKIPEQNTEPLEKNTETSEQNTEIIEQNTETSEKNTEILEKNTQIPEQNSQIPEQNSEKERTVLNSILDELDEPELDVPKQNKYFFNTQPKDTLNDGSQLKKRFVFDSDDENENSAPIKKSKKLKKRKAEKRALQISGKYVF